MATTSQASAAPVPITLAGVEYRMSPLTDADYGELERWLQVRIIQLAQQATTGLDANARREILDSAMRNAQQISITSPEGQKALQSLEGVGYMLWLGLRHNHAGLTRQQVMVALVDAGTQKADPAQVEAAMAAFDLANSLPGAETGNSDPKK